MCFPEIDLSSSLDCISFKSEVIERRYILTSFISDLYKG